MQELDDMYKLPTSYSNLEGENFDFIPIKSYVKRDKLFVFGLVNNRNVSIVHSIKLRYLFYSKLNQSVIKLQGVIKDNWCFYPRFQSSKPEKLLDFSNYPLQLQSYFKKIYHPNSLQEAQEGWDHLLWFELSAIDHLVHLGIQKKQPQLSYKIKKLPFDLSDDQQQAWVEIQQDLTSNNLTNRLIYGEVGSGKSILMFLAAKHTLLNNKTTIILVPNCLLAQQLYDNFHLWDSTLQLQLIIKNNPIENVTSIIIGTHALFYRNLPKDIALLIVDEQQKFSVEQRQIIRKFPCDLIMLTATPSPRTLLMSQNQHINTSYLYKKNHIITSVVTYKSYDLLLSKVLKVAKNKLVLWVINSVHKAQELAEKTAQEVYTICIYGAHKQKLDLLNQMNKITNGLVVSTTVLEVGIDCDFSIVVIEQADQLGLAQLHQIRGRVGRKNQQKSYCVLLGDNLNKLKTIQNADDFIAISQLDMENRGASSILSNKQHGINLHFAKKISNYKIYDRPVGLSDIQHSKSLQPDQSVLQFFSKFSKISY